jgi:hypothetical protein
MKCRSSLQQFPLKSFPLDPKRHIRDSYGTLHILTEQVELVISRDGFADTQQDWFLVSRADNLGPSDAYDVILGGSWKRRFGDTYRRQTRKGKETIHRARPSLHDAVQHWVRSTLDEQENVDVNSLENGWAPLHQATRSDSESMVRLLLDRGADLNIRGDFGCAPIHLAVERKSEFMVCLLSDEGANVNIPDENGRTPLHYAVRSRAGGRMAKLLMDYNADPLKGDNDGVTPLHYAAMQDYKDCFEHIIQHRSFSHHADKQKPPTGPFIFLWDLPKGAMSGHDAGRRVLLDTVTLTKGADSVKINTCQAYVRETYVHHGVQLLYDIVSALHADDRRQSE